jgi:hypothetical protein
MTYLGRLERFHGKINIIPWSRAIFHHSNSRDIRSFVEKRGAFGKKIPFFRHDNQQVLKFDGHFLLDFRCISEIHDTTNPWCMDAPPDGSGRCRSNSQRPFRNQ